MTLWYAHIHMWRINRLLHDAQALYELFSKEIVCAKMSKGCWPAAYTCAPVHRFRMDVLHLRICSGLTVLFLGVMLWSCIIYFYDLFMSLVFYTYVHLDGCLQPATFRVHSRGSYSICSKLLDSFIKTFVAGWLSVFFCVSRVQAELFCWIHYGTPAMSCKQYFAHIVTGRIVRSMFTDF